MKGSFLRLYVHEGQRHHRRLVWEWSSKLLTHSAFAVFRRLRAWRGSDAIINSLRRSSLSLPEHRSSKLNSS